MKTAGRGNPNRWATAPCTPSPWRGRSEHISLDHTGWETRKTPAAAEVFFLDFPLYRTYQAESAKPRFNSMKGDGMAPKADYFNWFLVQGSLAGC
jgi:hypothetical protein